MNNDFEEKKRYCEAIIANYGLENPLTAEAYNNLAILYDKQGDYMNALTCYAKALNLQPGYVAAHQNLGLFFLKHEKFNEALTQFHNVVELDSNALMAHYHLGNLYLGKDQLDLAEKHYLMVLEINSEHTDTLSNLGVISFKRDQSQLAIDYFTKALAFDINHQDARNNMAATFMHYDRYENAIRHYEDLLRQDPSNDEYHYNIGVAYMNLGHLNEAIVHFEQVIEWRQQTSRLVASFNNLGAIYWRLDQKEKAQSFLSQALALEPNHASSQYMLAALAHHHSRVAPTEYVKNLFDNYAIQYDEHLCHQLKYQLPEQMEQLLEKHFNASSNKKYLPMSLDLGCGTGLSGKPLKQFSEVLMGVDLSEKMSNIAKKTGWYDEVYVDEIIHALEHNVEINQIQWNCICAAEVLEYFGDLHQLFKTISSHLKPEGIFLFSIELTHEKEYTLQETARFAHNPAYIELLAQKNHLVIKHQWLTSSRLQDNQPLPSCLFLLEKTE